MNNVWTTLVILLFLSMLALTLHNHVRELHKKRATYNTRRAGRLEAIEWSRRER